MPNVNAATMGMVPVGNYVLTAVGADATIVIPDDATGIYFQFRSGTGFYLWGDDASTPSNGEMFRGNSDQEIRLDLYPGCPFRYSNGTGQLSYLFFRAIDHESVATRR